MPTSRHNPSHPFDTIEVIYNKELEEYEVFFQQTVIIRENGRNIKRTIHQEVSAELDLGLIPHIIHDKIGGRLFFKGKLPDRFYIQNNFTEAFRTKIMDILEKLDRDCINDFMTGIPRNASYYGRKRSGDIKWSDDEGDFQGIDGIIKLEVEDILFLTSNIISTNYNRQPQNFFIQN